jgi:arylsulfatase A-like enzyme
MGKQNMYDHSLRAPFIIVGPAVKPNSRSSEPIYVQDVMATCLDLAGDEKREGIEFQSLLPILGGKKSRYESIYGAFMDAQRMVRHDGWKLILYPQLKVKLLYNLNEDPQELNNLAADASQLPRMRRLFGRLQALQKEHDDQLDLSEAYPQLSR